MSALMSTEKRIDDLIGVINICMNNYVQYRTQALNESKRQIYSSGPLYFGEINALEQKASREMDYIGKYIDSIKSIDRDIGKDIDKQVADNLRRANREFHYDQFGYYPTY